MQDIRLFHKNLYSTTDKVKQDIFILKFCEGQKPKRSTTNLHSLSLKYFVPTVGGGSSLRVCKQAFLKISGLSTERIEGTVRNFVVNGKLPKERRRGNRVGNKFEEIKLSIATFIESLKCAESHYCRGQTSRLYLPCDMTFSKLYKMCCQ